MVSDIDSIHHRPLLEWVFSYTQYFTLQQKSVIKRLILIWKKSGLLAANHLQWLHSWIKKS